MCPPIQDVITLSLLQKSLISQPAQDLEPYLAEREASYPTKRLKEPDSTNSGILLNICETGQRREDRSAQGPKIRTGAATEGERKKLDLQRELRTGKPQQQ